MKILEKDFVENKRVLLRLDLDLTDKEIAHKDHPRISFSLPTFKFLIENSSKITIISHRGRPEGKDATYSLRPLAQVLSSLLGLEIGFGDSFDSAALDQLHNKHQVVLVENLRFEKGEEDNSLEFAKLLASLGEVYVFDAFAVSHREHASVVGVPKILPTCVGLNFVKEIENLDKFLHTKDQPKVAIIGGAKLETKLPFINKMLKLCDVVLVGGKLLEENIPPQSLDNVKDVVIARKENEDYLDIKTIDYVKYNDFPGFNILDIGQKSAQNYQEIVDNSKTVVWNGPMGLFEREEFAKGTNGLAKSIAQSHAFSIVGGGETLEVVIEQSLVKSFSHLCLGGGAMLEYLADEKLAFLEAING